MTPDDIGMWSVAIFAGVIMLGLTAAIIGLAVAIWREALREARE